MAAELTANLDPGLSVTATLMLAGAVAASGIGVAESIAVPGFYVASVPPATAEALYAVLFLVDGKVEAQGLLDWTGTAERVMASQASVSAIPTTPLLAGGYTAPNNTGISTLLSRVTAAVPLATDWTPARAAKIDNMDVLVSSRNAVAPDNVGILAAIAGISGGSGSDPLLSVVPGAYPVSSAGYALGKLNAAGATAPVVIIPGAPADLSMCRLYGYFETVGNAPAAGLAITITLVGTYPLHSNKVLSGKSITATTDSAGRLSDGANPWVDLQRNDLLGPVAGTQYKVVCREAGINSLVSLTTETANLLALIFP